MRDGTGWLTKPVMFISSYAPLFLMLAIRFDDSVLRLTCLALGLAGIFAFLIIQQLQKSGPAPEHNVVRAAPAGSGASSYLAGYLLPFVTVPSPTLGDLGGYGLFLLVALIVHVRTDIIQVNPILFLFGWRIYAVEISGGFLGHLISRKRVLAGDKVKAYRMTDDILLARNE
ncbi:hypothetical protein QWJ39_03515 [Arthrobacter sp. YD4]|uniref:hypothetical protein n=1 Tax=Arthrobacter sp. YD4 TaxID=3058043 RepID=UPI0025B4E17A|nr:hypothetical protein [Arthrobacter sp. YD4]MDN3935383.1 hypothetical protein [Arthrobacter sp. YD4]